MKSIQFAIFALLFGHPVMADLALDVIVLKHRPASELIPLLSPLFDNQVSLIDGGSNLLVKSAPDQLAQIKSLIQQLDVSPSNLIISVVQSRQITADELNAVGRNDTQAAGENNLGHLYYTQDKSADEGIQSIRTVDGESAHIKIGNIYNRQNFSYLGFSNTELIEVTSGFVVIPHLLGNQVTLGVAPWSDSMRNNTGQIQTRQAQTTIRMNLGEWVEIGNASEIRVAEHSDMITRQIDKEQVHILVKVERID